MDWKFFVSIMAIGFAIVLFVVFLTDNPVWQTTHRLNLEALRTASDDANSPKISGQPARPVIVFAPSSEAPPVSPVSKQSPSIVTEPEAPKPAAAPAPDAIANRQEKSALPADAAVTEPPVIQPYSAVDEFFHEYEQMLEEINAESDADKQEEICRDTTKQLDDKLRNQTWEFNCLIEKIDSMPDHLFNIAHQAPDEVDLVPDGWTLYDRAVDLPLLQLANKQQIFKGDYIVYVGTPRFDTVLADADVTPPRGQYSNLKSVKKVQPLSTKQLPDVGYFQCKIEIAGVPYQQTVHLMDANVKFIKGNENIARMNWQKQLQQPRASAPQQVYLPPQQQQLLAQATPYAMSSNATSPYAAGSGSEVLSQTNNYYSSTHPYYLYPEWLVFYHNHHFHHVHEHEVDFARNTLPTNSATVVKPQVAVRTPTQQRTSSIAAKPVVKPAPKPVQSK